MASKGDINNLEVQPFLYEGWDTIEFEQSLEKPGQFEKLKSSDFFVSGQYPVIDQGEKFIAGYINEVKLLYQGLGPVIIFGDHTRVLKFVDFKFAVGADGTKILRPLDNFDAKFYFYYLKVLKIPSFGYSRHYSVLKSIEIPLPPLAEQKRIVAKLDAAFGYLGNIKRGWDKVISNQSKFIESCLMNSKEGVFHNREKLYNYLEERTGRIGKNWENKQKVGVSAQKGIIELDTGQKESFENYKIVRPGDFVYNAMRVNIGSIAQYEGKEIAITSPDYIVFRVREYLSPKLLLGFLKSPMGLMEIGANTKGSVRSRLYFKSLANINYPIAPENVQKQAEEILQWYSAATKKWATFFQDSIVKIEQALLAKAFRGELVPQDPTDEPALVLLQKIKTEAAKGGKKKEKNGQIELAF